MKRFATVDIFYAFTKISSEQLSNYQTAKTKTFLHEGNYYLMQEPYYGSCLMSLSVIFASKQ